MKIFLLYYYAILSFAISAYCEVEQDYKNMLMYLTEPLVNQQEVNGLKMDGAHATEVAPYLISFMDRVMKNKIYSNVDFSGLKVFREALSVGFEVDREIGECLSQALEIQNLILDKLKDRKMIYVTNLWSGTDPHATVLGMKQNPGDLFDLVVINTGDGLGYHPSIPDPNGVYPSLYKLWITYRNIPKSKIFGDDAWFAKALILIREKKFMEKVEPGADYFYRTILYNIRQYLEDEPQIPDLKSYGLKQRSGTCTMSSMLVALLHSLQDRKLFYWYRAIIGQEILRDFTQKYKTNESISKYIGRGFDPYGRHLLEMTTSGLSNFVAQYLEDVYPEHFLNSILVGPDHDTWLDQRKEEALKVLTKDPLASNLLNETIKICLDTFELLKKLPVDSRTNFIRLFGNDEPRKTKPKRLSYGLKYQIFKKEKLVNSVNPYDFLKSNPLRPGFPVQITELNKMISRLKDCLKFSSCFTFTCALDTFKKSGNHWWTIIESSENKIELLELMEIFSEIAGEYVQNQFKLRSLDDFLLLANLQLGSWKAASVYDKLVGNIMGLSAFAIPNVIQKIIKDNTITSLTYVDNFVWNNFATDNLKLLKESIAEMEKDQGKKSRLVGPNEFSDAANPRVLTFVKFNESLDSENRNFFSKLKELKEVKDIEKSLAPGPISKHKDVKLAIILTEKEKLKNVIPHFHHLMNTLFWVNLGANSKFITLTNYSQFLTADLETIKGNETAYLNFKEEFDRMTRYSAFLPSRKNDHYDRVLPSQNCIHWLRSKFSARKEEATDHFIISRRIDANSLQKTNVINFETWLNYVKNSLDSKIFSDPHFQLISDNLLNTPYVKFGSDNNISLNNTYPSGFDPDMHVVEVFESMKKLMENDLKRIVAKTADLTIFKVTEMVRSISAIGLILARFLERVEYDKLVSGSVTSKLLANLYSLLYPFGLIKNSSAIPLRDIDVHFVNHVLAYICSFDLRNEHEFIQSIQFYKDTNLLKRFRRTLTRLHVFLSKISISASVFYTGIEVHLKVIGFIFHKIDSNEVEFSNYLLNKLFLCRYASETKWTSFNYASDGDVVEMIGTTVAGKEMKIAAQLSGGNLVIDHVPVASKIEILDSLTFKELFKLKDWLEASKGVAFVIGTKTVYVLDNFKNQGSSFIFINDPLWNYARACKLWNGEWYNYLSGGVNDFLNMLNIGIDFKADTLPGYHVFKRATLEKLYKEVEGEDYEDYGESGYKFYHEIILADNSNSDPLMTAKVDLEGNSYKSKDENPPIIEISIRNIKAKYKAVSSNSSKSIHLENFTKLRSTFGFCQKVDSDRMVLFFPFFRLGNEDPLIFVERDDEKNKFDILNLPGYYVEPCQTVNGVFGFLGTLRIKNQDGESFLLVPVMQRSFENPNDQPADLVREFEFIPFLNGIVAPQTRFQKLLLAYYSTVSREFDFALELINPNISIDHNSVFSVKELEIIKWFYLIDIPIPEADAIAVFVHAHVEMNMARFPFEYDDSNRRAPDLPLDKSNQYFNSLRDLPEKFLYFKLFPEVFSKGFKRKAIEAKKNVFKGKKVSENDDGDECYSLNRSLFENSFDKVDIDLNSTWYYGTVDYTKLFKFFYNRSKDIGSKEFKILEKFLKREKINTPGSFEMITYCLINHFETWKEFVEHLHSERKLNESANSLNPTQLDWKFDHFERNRLYNNAVNECRKLMKLDKAIEEQSMVTAVQDDQEETEFVPNLLLSRPEPIIETVPLDDIKFNLIDDEDLEEFRKISGKLKALESRAKKFTNEPKNYFKNIGSSAVLAKLGQSIQDYLSGAGEISINEFEISSEVELVDFLRKFRLYLEAKIMKHDEIQNQFAADLVARTRFEPGKSDPSGILAFIMRLAHKKESKTFHHLYACYQNGSIACFHKKFPELSVDECKQLRHLTAQFYSHNVLVDYFTFILEKVETLLISGKMTGIEEISMLQDELSKIEDFNTRSESQTILNFEFRSKKYRLKPEQVKDIAMLTTKDPVSQKFHSIVIQRMMAAGKTLVLGTISIIKKAQSGETLSILVPPSSLYQSNTSSMQIRTYTYFKKKGVAIHFPRIPSKPDKEQEIKFLNTVLTLIKNTMKNGNYLILSPETLHSFLNSYIEALDSAAHNPKLSSEPRLKLYAEIYTIFRSKSSIIMDEIDMTMDPRKELNFPTMDREPYNMVAAALISDIIEFLLFDQNVRDAGLNIRDNNQAKMTPQQYDQNIKKLIFQHIETQLKDEKSIWCKLLKDIPDHAALINFLKSEDMLECRKWIEPMLEEGNVIVANAIIILKVEIRDYLKESLKAAANLNYGLPGENRPGNHFAVPYVAANTPSPSSEFADRWETLNKTLLTFASVSCNQEVAAAIIEHTVNAINKETSATIPHEETTAWKNFVTFIPGINPISLKETDKDDVEMVFKALKTRSPAAIRILFGYCVDKVFSGMNFAVEQVTSNALHMASMFGSVQGYSGTIDNVNILPAEVVDQAHADHLLNEKNNGGIAFKLLKDSGDAQVPELSDKEFSNNAEKFISNILKKYANIKDKVSAIIDAGAFFKNFNNHEIAKALLNTFEKRIKVVLYYDERSNQLEFVRKVGDMFVKGYLNNPDPDSISKTTQTVVGERFTFYDHRHITGSDILQPKYAHAILTIGTRILLRDILQGTLRMRQFMTTQTVHLITSTSAKEFYFTRTKVQSADDPVSVSDMLSLGAINEDDKQGFENEKLAFVKVDTEIRRFILEEITFIINKLDSEVGKLIGIWFKNNRNLFIRLIKEDPLSWLMTQEYKDPEGVLKSFIDSRLEILTKIIQEIADDYKDIPELNNVSQRFDGLKNKLGTLSTSLLSFLKGKKIKSKSSDAQGSEVEMQLDVNILVDVDLEALIEIYDSSVQSIDHEAFNMKLLADNIKSANIPDELIAQKHFLSLNSILTDPGMSKMHKIIVNGALLTSGNQIGVSLDMVEVIHSNENQRRPFKIFSKYTREGTHLLVQVLPEKKGIRVLLLSSTAAQNVYKNINQMTDSTFWLCDLSGRVTATNDKLSVAGMNVLHFIPASRLLIFDALVFNGSFSQIISIPELNYIYKTFWLADKTAITRAQFLLLRMKVLFDKATRTIESTNKNLIILEKVSRGNLSAIKEDDKEKESNSSLYQKPAIDAKVETDYCTEHKIKKSSLLDETLATSTSSKIQVRDVYCQLIGPLSFIEEPSLELGLPEASLFSQPDLDPPVTRIKPKFNEITEWIDVQGCPEQELYVDKFDEIGDVDYDSDITFDTDINWDKNNQDGDAGRVIDKEVKNNSDTNINTSNDSTIKTNTNSNISNDGTIKNNTNSNTSNDGTIKTNTNSNNSNVSNANIAGNNINNSGTVSKTTNTGDIVEPISPSNNSSTSKKAAVPADKFSYWPVLVIVSVIIFIVVIYFYRKQKLNTQIE